MASDQEGWDPLPHLLDKVRVGEAARPGPHLEVGVRELPAHVQFLEIRKYHYRH